MGQTIRPFHVLEFAFLFGAGEHKDGKFMKNFATGLAVVWYSI